MTLKEKTISGLKWSFADNFVNQGLQFVVGIILARLLSPKEFGLIGMLTIFIAISQSFIDSGFSQALIRKNECTTEDYSTVFFYNLGVGLFLYFLLFLFSRAIGNFYHEPILTLLIKVLGINIIISSLSVIQRTILTKNINFKLQTKISVLSSLLSGIIGIVMAFSGWGVWSLVWRNVAQNIINSLLLWLWNGWRPAFIFSIKSFRELFGFGSKLLISGLLDTTFTNIYYLVIGKYYSAVELGFYTRADQFKNFPSQNLTSVIQRVSYPALASIQTDPQRLKRGYKDLIKNAMLVSFVLMIGMATVAKPLVITLIGKKWLPLVPYLQLLCLSGMLYPLHALNLNMLAVQGRSDLFLKLEIIKKTLVIPVLIIGVLWGIKIMILGMFINSIIAYFLNSYWSGKMINYSMKEQINDILPSFYIALIMAAIVWFVGTKLPMQYPAFVLSLQIILGSCVVILSAHLINLDAYFQMKDIIRKNIIHVKV
jgi:O-antigen/teichoic acid export membrane protein